VTATIHDVVAMMVRSVCPVWATTGDASRSGECGGVGPGYRYEAFGAKVTTSGSGWSRSWSRHRVAAVVADVCGDPDVAPLLEHWRALTAEAATLQRYVPSRGRHVSTHPDRTAVLDRERQALRTHLEHTYSTRAAAVLLGVTAQLSLFEAAS